MPDDTQRPKETQVTLAFQRIFARMDGQVPSWWIRDLQVRASRRADPSQGPLGELAAFLGELIRPLARRAAILESAPIALSKAFGLEVSALCLLEKGRELDEAATLSSARRAVASFRQIVLVQALHHLKLPGSELMHFWRRVLPADLPHAGHPWPEKAPDDLDGEGWSLVCAELYPGGIFLRDLLARLDDSLESLWHDCGILQSARDCRLQALGLEAGRWKLSLNLGRGSSIRERGFGCSRKHKCPLDGPTQLSLLHEIH